MRTKLVIIGLLAVATAFGQRGGGSRSRGGGSDMGPMSFGPKNKLEQISDMLQLSKEQKKDVKSLMDATQKEAAPVREELSKSHAEVAQAVASGKQDQIDKAIASHSEVEAKMAGLEMKAFAEIYKLLDQDQRTKTRGLFVMMPGIFHSKNWVDTQ